MAALRGRGGRIRSGSGQTLIPVARIWPWRVPRCGYPPEVRLAPYRPAIVPAREAPLMPNRLATQSSPYLLQHADNPVDWYPWADEAFERARTRGQADLPERRLLGVSLVPRDGARELRGRGHGGADERALREHQGRPRGAPRRRRHLHGGRAGAHGPGRLADERVPHARRGAVLRRHLLPTHEPLRHAVVHRRPEPDRHAVGQPPRRTRRSRRRACGPRSRRRRRPEPARHPAHSSPRRSPRQRLRSPATSTPPTAAGARPPSSRSPRSSTSCCAATSPLARRTCSRWRR